MKLKQLKLHKISQNELTNRQMRQTVGGQQEPRNCGCGCNSDSGTWCNANANWYHGYSQSYGGNSYCATWFCPEGWQYSGF